MSRKILSQTDGPTPGYVTLIVDIEIEPGVMIGRHTHPGIESAYMLDGGFDLTIEGQPTKAFKPGDAVVIPPNTPHAGGKNGDRKSHIISTYIVEKDKPLLAGVMRTIPSFLRRGRARPGHPLLSAGKKASRGSPGQAR